MTATPEATNDAEFKQLCGAKIGICVIGVFNRDSPSFENDLKTFSGIAGSRAGQPLSFLWLHAPTRSAFTDAFSVRSADMPTVVALSPQKLRFATLREAYTAQHVGEFLDGVMRGTVGTVVVQVRLIGFVGPQADDGRIQPGGVDPDLCCRCARIAQRQQGWESPPRRRTPRFPSIF